MRAHGNSAAHRFRPGVAAYHIVFLSGAPGAGKTLVGLDISCAENTQRTVRLTGNSPLVDVLNSALETAYRTQGARETHGQLAIIEVDAKLVASAASFKIVKAHNFLGERGHAHKQETEESSSSMKLSAR